MPVKWTLPMHLAIDFLQIGKKPVKCNFQKGAFSKKIDAAMDFFGRTLSG